MSWYTPVGQVRLAKDPILPESEALVHMPRPRIAVKRIEP